MFQENKASQISPKNEHFLPPDTYQGVNVRFSENLACFVFLKHLFWDLPFCLITNNMWNKYTNNETMKITSTSGTEKTTSCVIIYCFLERQNFEISFEYLSLWNNRAALKNFKIKYSRGALTRGNMVLVK